MDLRYFYALWAVFFLLIWAVFFWKRKDLRIEMLVISVLFGFGGVLSQQTHLVDWWRPLTVTGTPVGIEDFLIGFAIGGISSVIYAFVYHKVTAPVQQVTLKRNYLLLPGFAFLFLALFYWAGVNSFYSAIIAYGFGISLIIVLRPDLAQSSFVSGVLLLFLGSFTYYGLFLLYPNYIHEFWYLRDAWYATLFFGVPVGEYIWYFLTGAFIGPLFEFIEDIKSH